MDSEGKASRREETSGSMLEAIKERLRPLFLRKYAVSRIDAKKAVDAANMTDRERQLFLSGFEQGWVRGAIDATTVGPADLDTSLKSVSPLRSSKVH